MEDFNEFKRLVEEVGMTARMCTQYHWQINGGSAQVNWWPSTKRMAAKGSTGRSLQGSVAKAIELAKAHRSKPLSVMECAVKGMQYREDQRRSMQEYDTRTRYIAWIALICGAIYLSITIGRLICEIW